MRFEFDAAKSAANKLKHGIDFVEAQALWADPDRLETPARTVDEPRFQSLAASAKRRGRPLSPIAMKRSASSRSVGRAQKKRRGTSQTKALTAANSMRSTMPAKISRGIWMSPRRSVRDGSRSGSMSTFRRTCSGRLTARPSASGLRVKHSSSCGWPIPLRRGSWPRLMDADQRRRSLYAT